MNEQQFNASLKAAFVAPAMPIHMDHKIDAAINQSKHRKVITRRLTLSMGATAMAAVGIFVFPAVQGQAALGGMLGALDKQTKAVVTTYSVDEQGKTIAVGSAVIADGNIETRDAKQMVKQVDVDSKSYAFDLVTKSYIEYPRQASQGMKLSQMLGQASRFALGKRVTVKKTLFRDKSVLRATVTNTKLPERYVIDADSATQLPIHMSVEALEQGKWRTRQVIEFQYGGNLTVSKPDFSKIPLITKDQRTERMNRALTSNELGRYEAKNKTVVVRAVDVAQDGTVFVAFQSGMKYGGTWNGYQLSLKDNLGTNYVRAGDILWNFESQGKIPTDGVFETEVFIPVKPIASSTKREVSVSIAVDDRGDAVPLVREVPTNDNVTTDLTDPYSLRPTMDFPLSAGKVKFVNLLSHSFAGTTCMVSPSWAGFTASDFQNDVFTEIFKSRWLSLRAMEAKEWASAEKHLNDELYWKRESEVQGLSPWEMDSTLKNLDAVKKHLRP